MSVNDHPKAPLERNVKSVVLGNLRFKTWYNSLYPDELVGKDTDCLFVCRWCFRYSCDVSAYAGHAPICAYRTRPPGTKIYDCDGYTVWEVDGEDQKLFAQNMSLFAKLFLDQKSVLFDVSSFLYYVLAFTNPNDPSDYHILGYFSKEKMSWDANNLACILIFPPYQHKQLGKLLMGVSYKLSSWEWEGGFIGGPERPLSEMGRRSYARFWEERIARFFLLGPPGSAAPPFGKRKRTIEGKMVQKMVDRDQMTVREISHATGMLVEDVITALKGMGIVETVRSPGTKKKRKRPSSPAIHGEEESAGEPVYVRKESVLEWAKIHGMDLRDLVQKEGFQGQWAGEEEDDDSNEGAEEE